MYSTLPECWLVSRVEIVSPSIYCFLSVCLCFLFIYHYVICLYLCPRIHTATGSFCLETMLTLQRLCSWSVVDWTVHRGTIWWGHSVHSWSCCFAVLGFVISPFRLSDIDYLLNRHASGAFGWNVVLTDHLMRQRSSHWAKPLSVGLLGTKPGESLDAYLPCRAQKVPPQLHSSNVPITSESVYTWLQLYVSGLAGTFLLPGWHHLVRGRQG